MGASAVPQVNMPHTVVHRTLSTTCRILLLRWPTQTRPIPRGKWTQQAGPRPSWGDHSSYCGFTGPGACVSASGKYTYRARPRPTWRDHSCSCGLSTTVANRGPRGKYTQRTGARPTWGDHSRSCGFKGIGTEPIPGEGGATELDHDPPRGGDHRRICGFTRFVFHLFGVASTSG